MVDNSTPEKSSWKPRFLEALAECGNVSASAEQAGICRSNAYKARKVDAEFAAEWGKAKHQGGDALEDEAIRRAVHGVDTPMTIAGKREIVKKFSDTLLIFLLKAHDPARFSENVHVKGDYTHTITTSELIVSAHNGGFQRTNRLSGLMNDSSNSN